MRALLVATNLVLLVFCAFGLWYSSNFALTAAPNIEDIERQILSLNHAKEVLRATNAVVEAQSEAHNNLLHLSRASLRFVMCVSLLSLFVTLLVKKKPTPQ